MKLWDYLLFLAKFDHAKICKGCQKFPIFGLLHKCNICDDELDPYYLCNDCKSDGKHSMHESTKILSCELCHSSSKYFNDLKSLQMHVEHAHKCNFCNESFAGVNFETYKRNHLEEVHKG